MISYMMVILAFLARTISYQKIWYHVWYHSLCCDIMYDTTKTIIKSLSCAIIIEYCLWYHIHIIWFCPWYLNYVISYLLLRMIYAFDISITRYHSHMISHILWYLILCHCTCAAGLRGLGAPAARCSTGAGSSYAIANMPGTHVQLNLNGDFLDAAHGLVALTAVRVMHRGRFVVIKKSLLAAAAAAGCAAHEGKAPMHCDSLRTSMDSKSKMDSSLKLARRVSQATSTVASSTWKLELRVWTERDRCAQRMRKSHALRTEAASPKLLRDVLLPRPPLTGFKVYNF